MKSLESNSNSLDLMDETGNSGSVKFIGFFTAAWLRLSVLATFQTKRPILAQNAVVVMP